METIDTRNVQTVEIEKLNERIADDRQMLRLQDDSINKLLHICRNNDATIDENREMHETIRELEAKLVGKDATIDVQRAAIHVMSGGHGKRIIADNEMLKDGIAAAAKDSVKAMKLIRDRGDEIKELEEEIDERINKFKRLEEMHYDSLGELIRQDDKIDNLQDYRSEFEREINSLHADAKELRKECDEYKESIKLERIEHNTERKATTQFQNDKIKELKATLIDVDKLFAERGATIEILEATLTDRERQFNELDGVFDRTRELLHAAMDRIRKQNHEIDVSNKAAEIADEDAEYWWCIHNEDDVFIHRLLDGNNTFNGVLDDCRADVRERDKIIDELKHNRSEFSR